VADLEITLQIDPADRAEAAAVYSKYRDPFLGDVAGARSKDVLIGDEIRVFDVARA
jgi:hypothetical protein